MAVVTNILWADGGIPTGIGSGDSVTAPGDWSFTGTGLFSFGGSVSIAGNLNVEGDITARNTVNLTVADPFIDLGLGNSSTVASAGGFTIQMASVTATPAQVYRFVTATQFEINDGGATALAANQIIAITGLPAAFAANEGLYAVDSVSGTGPQVVNIKSTATASAPFLQTAFTNTATTVLNAGAAFQTQISALAFANNIGFPDSLGVPYAAGTLIENYAAAAVLSDFTNNAAWTPVGAGTTTLQNAYDNGPTITTASSTPITFTLTSGGFDVQSGAVNFGSGALTAVSSFDVEASSAVTVVAGAASSISTTAGDLTLNAQADSVIIDGGEAAVDAVKIDASNAAGGILIQSGTYGIDMDGDTGAVLIQSNKAAADAIKLLAGNSNAATTIHLYSYGSGASAVDIDSLGGVTIDANEFSIDASAASNITVSTGNLNVGATTGQAFFYGQGGAELYSNGGNVDINASAGSISLGAGLASDFTAATGDLSLTATANSVVVTGGEAVADAIQLTASDSSGGIDINAGSGGITLDSNGGNIALTAIQPLVYVENKVFLDAAGVPKKLVISSKDTYYNQTSFVDLRPGGSVTINTAYSTNLYSPPELSTYSLGDTNIYGYFGDIRLGNRYSRGVLVQRAMGLAVPMEASENLPMCSIVAITSNNGTTPIISLARSGGTTLQKQVIGITNRRVATTTGGTTEIYTVPGTEMVVLTSGSIVAADAGKPVYLNGTGLASLTPPSASGEAIIRVGYVTRGGASGGGGEYGNPTTPLAGPAAYIMFAPQFIAQIP